MRFSAALFVLSLVSWLPLGAATAYTVTLDASGSYSSRLVVGAANQFQVVPDGVSVPVALPYSNTATVVDGASSAQSTYALTNSGFDIMVDLTRSNLVRGIARSEGKIYFSVDETIAYVASGSYSVIDPEGRRAFFAASLTDNYSTNLFVDNHWSNSTPNETFTLGEAGGDFLSGVSGSLTGILIPGRRYAFAYQSSIFAMPSGTTDGASAAGNFSLRFMPVPEPGTGLLMSVGLTVLAASRRRSGRRAT